MTIWGKYLKPFQKTMEGKGQLGFKKNPLPDVKKLFKSQSWKRKHGYKI